MGTILTAPATFTGISSYASDLQQVITRAVSMASLPLQLQQNQLTDMQNQSSALSGLDSDFAALQSAFQNLQAAFGDGSYSASSSDAATVGASAASGALEATYTIDVSSLGSYATAVSDASLPAVSDPTTTSISTSSDYTLSVNDTSFDIKPADGSLLSLAQAINASGAGVQASLVNTSSSTTPQYCLAIRSDSLGAASIQLNDGQQDLLDPPNGGDLASYSINGMAPIQTDSRTETLEPGVTINLLQETPAGQPATVTVSRNLDAASSAISGLVSAYNTVVDALNQEVGVNAGALSGDSIISTLRDALRQITQYTSGSGTVASLADIGVNLDSSGKLSFDSTQFNSDSADALQSFLGDTATGFLRAANDALNSVEDPINGSLKNEESQITQNITQQNSLIAQTQQKITDMQNALTQQMEAADATLASLDSQKTYFTNLFTAMINASTIGVQAATG